MRFVQLTSPWSRTPVYLNMDLVKSVQSSEIQVPIDPKNASKGVEKVVCSLLWYGPAPNPDVDDDQRWVLETPEEIFEKLGQQVRYVVNPGPTDPNDLRPGPIHMVPYT